MDMTLTKTRIRAGVWEGLLTSHTERPSPPDIEVRHLELPLDGVTVTLAHGMTKTWAVRVPIPVDVLSDGVQTFLIHARPGGEKLESFTIITGAALEDDIRAEIDLLRAELDMLKRAFRRHCLETAG